MSPTGRSRIRRTLLAAVACAVAFAVAGCGGGRAAAPRRVVEREETVGKAHVRLRSELSPARGTLGDRIEWRITATLGGGARPGRALLAAAPAALEMDSTSVAVERAERSGLVWSREYILRGFDLGPIELPHAALPVLLAGRSDTFEFPRDTLFVDSLTQAVTGAIRPDRGPINPPLRPVDYFVAALAALFVVVAVLLLIRWIRARRRRERSVAPALPDPPETTLLRALDELERELGSLPRDVFYERLAMALRTYAAPVTGVPAHDLTTTELERELDRDPRVIPEGRDALIQALRRADLAKFGRFQDEESEAKSILRQAKSISGKLAIAHAPPTMAGDPATDATAPRAGAGSGTA